MGSGQVGVGLGVGGVGGVGLARIFREYLVLVLYPPRISREYLVLVLDPPRICGGAPPGGARGGGAPFMDQNPSFSQGFIR